MNSEQNCTTKATTQYNDNSPLRVSTVLLVVMTFTESEAIIR